MQLKMIVPNKMIVIMLLRKKHFFLLILLSHSLYAHKLSLGLGAYSVDAKVGSTSSSISNFGAYRIQYNSPIRDFFELTLAYTVLIEDIISGDKAFGPSVGLSYYPFGPETAAQFSDENLTYLTLKNFNPYLNASFNQRQYQSIDSSYSGFSIGGGVEFGLTKALILMSELQYAFLEGPNEGELTEIIVTGGISLKY